MNKPLDNWPALRTSSTEVAEHTLCSTFGARNFEAASTREEFCAHANYKQLSALSLSYCSYTRPVTIEFPEAPFFRQAFSVVGAGMFFIGDRECMISAERSAVVHPGVPLRAEFSGDFEQLLLRIDESALARKLSALVETPMDSKIEIVPRHEDGTGFAALQRLVSYLAGEISAPDTALAAPALAELEQAVLVAFLYANPILANSCIGSHAP